MFLIVCKQARHELGRVLMTVLAIALVIAEILLLEGFLVGLYAQLRGAVLDRGGDLIVAQSGISNFIAARSILPQLSRLQVEEIDGVQAANPITALAVIYDQDGRKTPIFVVVHDGFGGPKQIVAGGPVTGDREVVIDRSLALKYGFSVGDPIILSDFEFRIAGISANSAAFFTPFAFMTYDDLIDFYLESDIAEDIATFPLLSFLLVTTEPGADLAAVAAAIENNVVEADVLTPEELARNDQNLGRDLMGPILGLLLAVSYGIGALVVGMFMLAAVRARRQSLGVLRALGFRSSALGRAVVLEASVLTLIALPFGVVAAQVLAGVISTLAPVYLILPLEPVPIARTAAVCLVLASLGALGPVRMVARLDPATVFRG